MERRGLRREIRVVSIYEAISRGILAGMRYFILRLGGQIHVTGIDS